MCSRNSSLFQELKLLEMYSRSRFSQFPDNLNENPGNSGREIGMACLIPTVIYNFI